MKKVRVSIFIITILILSIGLVSSLYAGETQTYPNDLGKDNLIYTIIDNTSELNAIPNISINQTNIIISIPSNMSPNSFTIVFLEEQTKEIVKEVYVSNGNSGGSRTITKYINNTIYKEVPYYITQYEKIEDITEIKQNTTQDNNILDEEKEFPLWILITLLLIVPLIALGLIIYFSARNRNVRRLEENGRESEY
jgi:hypothetical protein